MGAVPPKGELSMGASPYLEQWAQSFPLVGTGLRRGASSLSSASFLGAAGIRYAKPLSSDDLTAFGFCSTLLRDSI